MSYVTYPVRERVKTTLAFLLKLALCFGIGTFDFMFETALDYEPGA
jgi:hypothetical protein